MREIFQNLPRNDLLHCMEACRYWYQNILTVFHGWMLVWEDTLHYRYSWGNNGGNLLQMMRLKILILLRQVGGSQCEDLWELIAELLPTLT